MEVGNMNKNMNGSSEPIQNIRVLPINPVEFIPRNVPRFIETRNESARLQVAMESTDPLLLVGPKGIGKTLCIDAFAAKLNVPLIRYDCSDGTKKFDLYGRFTIIGHETVYKPGILATAIETANQFGTAVLVLEEVNALNGAMQKVLNSLLDYRHSLMIEELNKVYSLRDGANLLICATMNPSTYGGTNELNEDLKSRFAIWKWKYPEENEEREILNTQGIPELFVTRMLQFAQDTRNTAAAGKIEYALSPRDLDMFFRRYRIYLGRPEFGLDTVFEECILNKYDAASDIEYINDRRQSIFGKDVSR